MKKLALLSVLALCLGFTACDNYEEPNPPAQYNPQDEVLSTEGVSYTLSTPAQQQLNLNQYDVDGYDVPVAVFDLTQTLPAGFELMTKAQFSATEDFAKYTELSTDLVDNNVMIAPGALQAAIIEQIGKSPDAKKGYIRFAAYAVKTANNTKTTVRFGDPDFYYGPLALDMLPIQPSITIEDNYYLIGTASDMTIEKAIKMTHSSLSPYDDPVFKVVVDITNDQANEGWLWKIISETAYVAGSTVAADNVSFGVEYEGDDYMEGTLFANTADFKPAYGTVYEAGPYMLTVNMETLHFEISLAIEQLYTPGNSNSWNQGNSQILTTTDYMHYTGFAYLNGEFKFSSQPNWDGINYGPAGEGKLSTAGDAGNLNAPVEGLYYCKVNIIDLTYEITLIESLGVIGDLNGWTAQEPLTPSADFLTWTGTVKFDGKGGWKFRANDDWGINLGGELSNLVPDGANIDSPAAGDHKVTLDLSTVPYSATIE